MNTKNLIAMSECAILVPTSRPRTDAFRRQLAVAFTTFLIVLLGACSGDTEPDLGAATGSTADGSDTSNLAPTTQSQYHVGQLAAVQDAITDEAVDAVTLEAPQGGEALPVIQTPEPIEGLQVTETPEVVEPPALVEEVTVTPVETEAPVVEEGNQAPEGIETPAVIEEVTETPPVTQAIEPVPAEQNPMTETSDLPKLFTSHSTPGFIGQVQDDGSVKVSWNPVEGAKGYNLYRNSKYHTSINGDNTYIDTDTIDVTSIYYEVESYAFEEGAPLNRFGNGLSVKLKPLEVKLPAQIEANYDLVFSDEFDGTQLDSSKWNTSYIWGDNIVINSELQHYVDINNQADFGYTPFEIGDGTLKIKTTPTPDHLLEKANNQPYLSGVITSYDAFKMTYGYAEARVKLPRGRGFWAAFWLLNAYYQDRKPEIDIMEHLGHKLDTTYHTYHYYDLDGTLRSTESKSSRGIDFTEDFHTFSVEWRPGTLIYYVDAIEQHRVTDPEVSHEEMYLIANTAIGGWWPGDPDATTPFPATYEIDYIRAYQKRGLLDDPPLFDGGTKVPLATELPFRTPNHLPPPEAFPEGYPTR